MRALIATISAVILWPAVVFAQVPKWDTALTVGAFSGRPADEGLTDHGDEWWHAVEWRASVSRLVARHVKAEFELAATGNGDRFVTRFDQGLQYRPYSTQEGYQLSQGVARIVWQFNDNAWVQPYVSAGVSIDREVQRVHVFDRYEYSTDPRGTPFDSAQGKQPRLIARSYDEPTRVMIRPGGDLGAGVKLYVSPRAFIKTGMHVGASGRSTALGFFAGMGVDF